uniref:Uncharacterized protein n=1 Tax=Rhizophora mucronata TaxID=61149 RepID=A0A2P2IWE2_RHIMU
MLKYKINMQMYRKLLHYHHYLAEERVKILTMGFTQTLTSSTYIGSRKINKEKSSDEE